ncbi:MAG: metallophosphoesterase [bacterium]
MRIRTHWKKSLPLLALLGVTPLLWPEPAARAANPFAARYSHDGSAIFWILHISDTHIGASSIEGPNATPHFEFALGEAFDTIDPVVVVVTGDLCDGSIGAIPASGQSVEEWTEFRGVVDTAGMTTDIFIDVPGNHDGYGESGNGLTHYLQYSLNGSTFSKKTRSMLLSFPFGDYLLYGTSTPNEGSPVFVESPEFSADELTELETELTMHNSATLAFVFGHHRINQPDGSDQAINSLQQHGAFYFHGHLHEFGTYMQDNILSGQIDTLGKNDNDNIGVIAVDNDAISYAASDVTDAWPLILVTTPADRRLHSGDVSPYAYDVCNSAVDNPVRTLVFDSGTVTDVSFAVAGGAAVPMTQDPVEPALWHGVWDTTGLTVGETTLTVTAVGTTTRSQEVHVMLEDVTCPPVNPTPDAGVADATVEADAEPAGQDAEPTEDASGPGSDGSLAPGPKEGGCSCRAGGPLSSPALPALPVLLLLGLRIALRRRRA